jgi:hypothetical protein
LGPKIGFIDSIKFVVTAIKLPAQQCNTPKGKTKGETSKKNITLTPGLLSFRLFQKNIGKFSDGQRI